MPRHTSRNGVNCVFYFRAARSELIRKLFYKVLCLRDSHSVSGNDDDFFRVTQKFCGVFNLFSGFFFRLYFNGRRFFFFRLFKRYFRRFIHVGDKLLKGILRVAEIQVNALFA